MDSDIRRGRGRPKLIDSFDMRFRFCGNDDHEYMKRALEDELGKGGGDILREALETFYEFETFD